MGQSDEVDDSARSGNRHQKRHQVARKAAGKAGPGRPRKAPEHCRYVGRTKKHGHRYQACPRVGGKRVYGKHRSRDEARDEAAEIIRRGEITEGVTMISLFDACQDVLDDTRNDGTKRSYHEHFVTLCDYFGADTPLQLVTPQRIREFIHHRRGQRIRGQAPTELRIRKDVNALNRVFRDATMADKFAGANPVSKIKKPKGKSKESGHYTIAELDELFTDLRKVSTRTAERNMLFVAAYYFSALRRSEFCRLRVRDIDFKGGFIRDFEGKVNFAPAPITAPLAYALEHLVEGKQPTDPLVPIGKPRGPRKDNRKPSTPLERQIGLINGAIRRLRPELREALRSRFHPHTGRHTLRSILADHNVPEHVKNAITRHGRHLYEHTTPTEVRMWATRVLDPLLYLVDPEAERPAKALGE